MLSKFAKVSAAAKGTSKKTSAFLSAIGKAAGKSFEPLSSFAKGLSNVASRFKRILMYRAVRKLISEIGKAFKEGAKNLYSWASIVGNQFASSMDSITSSMNYLKNSLGAAAAPIVNVLAPAIEVVTNAVVGLINVVNQLLALLGGQTSWVRATRQAANYENAVGGAGGAAKEALRYLAPFDELNVLPEDKKSGGGGGSGATDYPSMFEETTEFTQGISDFATAIKNAVNAGDWQGLGTLLGDKVNEIIDKIDFAGLGKTIGEKINALFSTRYWTLETINFQNIGSKVAEFLTGENGIGGALNNIDFEVIGRGFVRNFTILPDILIGFLRDLDWGQVSTSVGEWLSGAFSEAADWIGGVDWSEVVNGLFNALKSVIAAINYPELVTSIFKFIGASLSAVTEIVSDMVFQVVDFFQNANAWELLKTWFVDVFWRGLVQQGINAINGLLSGINESMNNFIEKHPKLAEWLGIDGPVDLILVPNLDPPPGTLFNEIKAQFGKSKIPVNGEINSIVISGPGTPGPISVGNGRVTISATAAFTNYTKGFTAGVDSAGKPRIESRAQFTNWTNAFSGLDSKWRDSQNKPIIASRAKFTNWSNGFSGLDSKWRDSQNKPIIDTRAKFTNWTNGFAGLDSKWRDAQNRPIFPSRANFTTRDYDKLNRTFDSTANFTQRWQNVSTVFDSTANIVSDTVHPNLQYNGLLNLNANANIQSITGNTVVQLQGRVTYATQAGGGVLRNGKWNPVQSFAGGGSPYGGQIFRARENGNPELVGTLRGSTAVMNNDQIVASVSSGVARAIAGIRFQLTGGGGNSDMESAMYNAMSRALADNDSDIYLDGDVVYSKMLNRNRRETYRTGVNPMMAMG